VGPAPRAEGERVDPLTAARPGPVAEHAHAVLHCNLNTVDLDRAVDFYAGVLGLQPRMRSVATDADATAMGLGPATASVAAFLYDGRGPRSAPALELVGWRRPATVPRPPPAAPGFAAIGFRVASLAGPAGRLRALGYPGGGPRAGAWVRGATRAALTVTDPDGVEVEIVEIPPAAADPDGGLLSHERVRVSDLPRALDWYAAIGFAVRGRGPAGPAASLVLPEDPTFSLELEQAGGGAAAGAAAGSGGPEVRGANSQGLYRIALAVQDVHAAYAGLAARRGMSGVAPPVVIPMPDTPTGGFTVLFLRDPDGTVVELVERPRAAVRRPREPS
jgi:catechol 2,3-dioxygenase-like lactoylglutathione lyase family enzyme